MTIGILIDNLQRRYDSFINLPYKGFFLGIADYVKYLVDTGGFEQILTSIKKQKEEDERLVVELGKLVKKETEESAKTLLRKIKDENISFPQLDKALNEYQGTIEGKVQHLTSFEEALHWELSGIVRILFEGEYKKIASPYLVIYKESGKIADFNVSKNYSLYSDELKHFRELSETTIWGAFDNLILVYLVIHQSREEFNRLKSETNIWKRLNFKGLYDEMKLILEGKAVTPIHFIKENHLIYINRVHNFIVENLQILNISSLEEFLTQEDRKLQVDPEGQYKISSQTLNSRPCCITEGVWGYLKLNKFGKKKRIGKVNSRHFRLLQCLIENIEVGKTIDSVFDNIRLPKDRNDSQLSNWNTGQYRRIQIIKNAIKELQKNNKLEHKIIFEFNDQKTQIKALFVE